MKVMLFSWLGVGVKWGEFKQRMNPLHNIERISPVTFGFTVASFPFGTLTTVIFVLLPFCPPPQAMLQSSL